MPAFDIRRSAFDILPFVWDMPQPAKSGIFTPSATAGVREPASGGGSATPPGAGKGGKKYYRLCLQL
jgi:hypothetical protein